MKRSAIRMIVVAALLPLAFIPAPAHGQESKVQLKNAPGRDKVLQCAACHSLDYIPMNSRFLDRSGWTTEVNKMITAFGAPIPKEDVDVIVKYLVDNYGVPDKPQ